MPRQGDMARIDMPKADTPRTDTPKSVTPTPAEKPPEVSTTEFKPETPPPPAPNYLKREEVREVQQRLWSFGIDAGPVDGSAGPRTQMAAQQYRDKRGLLPAVDTVDYSLLEALRNDPTPQVARRAPPPATPTYYAQRRPPPRSNNPFDQLAAWFHSIGR
jgi:peptidoglycan hydrolase-like protein with peptidoglycan-binding domain